MIKEFQKGIPQPISDYFKSTEFDCHCKRKECDITYIDTDLIDYLEEKRAMLSRPFLILSGFRCTAHNKEVGGKAGSQHLVGKAADIHFAVHNIIDYSDFFKDADGLGIYRKQKFLHVDVRGHRARWEG